MLTKAPDSELSQDSNALLEAISNYRMLHVEAYVVHIDMVSQQEIAFKLTSETIEGLIEYHKDIYSLDIAASTWAWPEKDSQIKKMHEEFVQAVNRFVFRTSVTALEGLEEDGAGELSDGRSADVKTAIMNLFLPLLPPPPRIVDVVHSAPLLSNAGPSTGGWWQSSEPLALLPAPVVSWQVLQSSPSPTMTACSDPHPTNFWTNMGLDAVQLPSPTPSYSQPAYCSSADFYSSPQGISIVSAVPMSSTLPCGTSMMNCGFDGFAWSYNAFAPQYATI